ncbi:MAG: helix-turn-helix domain-containing protein [Hamadaea sp.]|nr:helix-turn-helix domain-containing protein [Hamadaea sp.]
MASASHGPMVARRQLSQALRAARDEAGQTQEQAAEALDWSISKMIRIENGKTRPTVTDVRALLDLYGVTESRQIAEFVDLARATRQRSWWTEYREHLPPGFADYVALEADASVLHFFHPMFIPGLFQTTAYAREALDIPWIEDLTREGQAVRLKLRQERQRHLLQDPGRPRVEALLDESALRRVVGGPDAMREQLHHLIRLGADARVTLRVLPFTAGQIHVVSPFIIMQFPNLPDVVYSESGIEVMAELNRGDISPYWMAYRWLAARALDARDSLTFIAKVAEE